MVEKMCAMVAQIPGSVTLDFDASNGGAIGFRGNEAFNFKSIGIQTGANGS
jgi:hypothetical protein